MGGEEREENRGGRGGEERRESRGGQIPGQLRMACYQGVATYSHITI